MSKVKKMPARKEVGAGLKQIAKLSLSLLIVTVASALVLSVVNELTCDVIAMRREAARQEAMACVVPGADVFSDLYSEDTTIDRITGAYQGTNFVGYCVEVSRNGFGGTINLMVGVSPSGKVTGVTVLDHGETPGMGAEAEKPEFLQQYVGKYGRTEVGGNINAITGATITSEAVTDGVNAAVTAVINYNAGGDQDYENDV